MTEEEHGGAFNRLLHAFLHLDQRALEDLAREGVPVDLRDACGDTVLLRAAALGEAAAVEWILQAGAEVEAFLAPETNASERTAFLLAAEHGHPKTAETLLAAGANRNRVDGEGSSALMLAAHRGHLETVRFLVRSGVDLDLENHRGLNALTLARSAGHHDIVALLQALGAASGMLSEAPRPGSTTTESSITEGPTTTRQIADQEWQTPSAPRILHTHPPHPVSSEDSIDDQLADDIEDEISDWIEDQAVDL